MSTEAGNDESTPREPRSHGPYFDLYESLTRAIADELPRVAELQQAYRDALDSFGHAVHTNVDGDNAVERSRSRIVNQANNDFLDLFYEVMSGRAWTRAAL